MLQVMKNYFDGNTSTLIIWSLKTLLAVLLFNIISFVVQKIYLFLKLRNVPHRKSHFLLGDLEDIWKLDLTDPTRALMKLENESYREFTDRKIRLSWDFWTPFLSIYDHEAAADILSKKNYLLKGSDYKYFKSWIGDGLLTSVSTKWHARRKLITPAFHFDILDHFAPIMIAHTKEFLDFLATSCENSDQWIKIDEHLSPFTLDVLIETTMGLTSKDLKDLRPSYVESVKTLGKYLFKRPLGIISRYDFLYYHTETGRKVKKALEIVRDFSKRAIQHRIEYLKQTQNNNLDDENGQEKSEITTKRSKKRALMDLLISAYLDPNEVSIKDGEDIREEVDTFMFAGHDTTASAIGWLIFILGNYPEVQERLYQELESCFESVDQNGIDHNKILSNRFLDACVKEGLRLISPVAGIGKTLPQDTEVCGHLIPKGTSVVIFFFYMHRDAKLYPDPLKFKPERFLDEGSRLPFSFVPFSAGPRNCIGQKFALMEIKIFTALLIHRFKLTSKIRVEDVEYCFEVVTRPIEPLDIKFEERH